MSKALFTQSVTVLLQRPVPLESVATALAAFPITGRIPARPGNEWLGGQPALVVALRPELNGQVVVDVVERPWPDGMGDPQADPDLFAAWRAGWFGPFAFPDALTRAAAMAPFWPEARAVVPTHRAFVRLLSTYLLGGDDDAPVIPEGYDPVGELSLMTDLCVALLELPEALAYFDPNGETLLPRAALESTLGFCRSRELAPLPVWSNVRRIRLPAHQGWSVMDTVGMDQLDVVDHEACFPDGAFDPDEIDGFLRNAADHLRLRQPVLTDGAATDGPGRIRWQAHWSERSLAPRPRRVLRWLPQNGVAPPPGLVGGGAG